MTSGGRSRTPEDTRGHAIKTVRDREAPGSNPGPPTKIRIRSGRHGWWWAGAVSQPYHNFLKKSQSRGHLEAYLPLDA